MTPETCAYPGANSVGQAHSSYPAKSCIIRVRAPALFPETFAMDCFRKGISGIIMSCGEECPYEGAYHALAKRIDKVYQLMKAEEIDINPPVLGHRHKSSYEYCCFSCIVLNFHVK